MNKQKSEEVKKSLIAYSLLNRSKQKTFINLVNGKESSKDDIGIIVTQLTPPYSECKKLYSELTIENYKAMINLATISIHTINTAGRNREQCQKLVRKIMSYFKATRKDSNQLCVKTVKTLLTESEYDSFISAMKSYNYKNKSAFLRDHVTDNIEVKPNNDQESYEYFRVTQNLASQLTNLISNIKSTDDLNDVDNLFMKAINELVQNILLTRNLAVNNHNQKTSKYLALHHLSSVQLRALYLEKLEQENE
ncbi:hypothetical protein [Vibrio tapetis]|uniref:Uncharacterized protein n=1 Tax=Vibrio tapetis subsp. tapetis TaxID=1671868 RepID=A0A2N8ZAS5_9VIBR|nr:hypothetical protein [Vibrio tapetis]SON49024.1 protein of unknown function [Vibrio tapetis subsp. tapetis]